MEPETFDETAGPCLGQVQSFMQRAPISRLAIWPEYAAARPPAGRPAAHLAGWHGERATLIGGVRDSDVLISAERRLSFLVPLFRAAGGKAALTVAPGLDILLQKLPSLAAGGVLGVMVGPCLYSKVCAAWVTDSFLQGVN